MSDSSSGHGGDGEALTLVRPRLFAIAYRMLGSVGDAEDVVQEAFLRLETARAQGARIDSMQAFMTTVTTRLAIDELRSARVRRETYFGPWLPEPLLVSTSPSAAEEVERNESLSFSLLVLLETLSPVERAVFVLRELFGHPYDEIAAIVGKSEANCRQINVRAKRRVGDREPRFEASRAEREELADRFFGAVRRGELDRLIAFLAEDVAFYGDGGGKARGLPRPVHGRERVHRLLCGFLPELGRVGGTAVRGWVNGDAGILFLDGERRLVSVWVLEAGGGGLVAIRSIINPDKLAHLGYPLSPLPRTGG